VAAAGGSSNSAVTSGAVEKRREGTEARVKTSERQDSSRNITWNKEREVAAVAVGSSNSSVTSSEVEKRRKGTEARVKTSERQDSSRNITLNLEQGTRNSEQGTVNTKIKQDNKPLSLFQKILLQKNILIRRTLLCRKIFQTLPSALRLLNKVFRLADH